MQTQPEAPAATTSVRRTSCQTGRVRPVARSRFAHRRPGHTPGRYIPGPDAPATGRAARSPAFQPPTRVRLDPRELQRRWSPVERTAERVRELRDGDTVLLSVELAPPAGYLLHAPGFARILVAPDGTELLCDPEPGSAAWNTLLPAQALPLAATLRGFEVLHASGVVLGDDTSKRGPGASACCSRARRGPASHRWPPLCCAAEPPRC